MKNEGYCRLSLGHHCHFTECDTTDNSSEDNLLFFFIVRVFPFILSCFHLPEIETISSCPLKPTTTTGEWKVCVYSGNTVTPFLSEKVQYECAKIH
jgi:hypothetical protein